MFFSVVGLLVTSIDARNYYYHNHPFGSGSTGNTRRTTIHPGVAARSCFAYDHPSSPRCSPNCFAANRFSFSVARPNDGDGTQISHRSAVSLHMGAWVGTRQSSDEILLALTCPNRSAGWTPWCIPRDIIVMRRGVVSGVDLESVHEKNVASFVAHHHPIFQRLLHTTHVTICVIPSSAERVCARTYVHLRSPHLPHLNSAVVVCASFCVTLTISR